MFYSLRVFLLVLRNFRLIAWHVELRRTFATHDGEALFRRALELSVVDLSILIFRFDIQHILHVELEEVSSARSNHARSFVNLETSASSVAHNEVVNVVICIGIASLQCKNWRIRWCIQLYNSLHGQWTVDEVWRLIVHIFHVNNHSLIVSVWKANRNL